MPTKQLIEFVNKLKSTGINVSFTKPRSQMLFTLHQQSNSAAITICSFSNKKQAVN